MKVCVSLVRKIVTKLFAANGLTPDDAQIVTNCLLEAELAGISTHGIKMVPAHIGKLKNGYNTKAEWQIEKCTPVFSVCNANDTIGMLSAWKCIELGVKQAAQTGMHIVLCHHANTFSAAYCYAQYAVEHGKIALICCNSPSRMAPFGGKEMLLGTNPLSIGIPADREWPFILDMATSVVSKSRINQMYFEEAQQIPDGWATDQDGVPTTDPKQAVKGMLLPIAGPKGYGLSMAIDIIAGVLSHAAFLDNVGKFYTPEHKCMNVGFSFIVIDPEIIYGSSFYQQMDEYFRIIRNSESTSQQEVHVPGDLNRISKNKMMHEGIEMTESLVAELNQLLYEAKLDMRISDNSVKI